MSGNEPDLERAAALVRGARRGIAFTGAGISAASGIRTYRGQDGIWKQHDPVKVAAIDSFLADPSAYWTVARTTGPTLLEARPNPAHLALAEMERSGHLARVVTQNVDGLHGDAGSDGVIELHGSGRQVRCLDCGAVEPRADVQARLETEMPPRCRTCGGMHLKPTVIFFGEALPERALQAAMLLAGSSDLMLVVGTSLVVYPAAQVPLTAHQAGAPMLIVNAEPTPFDDLAEVVIHGLAHEILPRLLA